MATFREMLMRLGALRTVEPVIDYAYAVALQHRFDNSDGDEPHGRPWHVSFHASSFPGDEKACGRFAMYGLMDVPKGGPMERWLDGVAQVGKTIELNQVRAARDAGMLVRSNQPGRSSDPDALTDDHRPMPQMGFVEKDTWLTGSVDMPLLPFNYDRPHIVEIKSKHESKIELMQFGERSYDEKHRKQLLCSLGLAHDHANDFLHPTEDRVLEPALDGSIYYVSRDNDWPGPVQTFEFFFEYDLGFMEEGRDTLKKWRKNFIEGELPQTVPRKNSRSHPFGWRWSEGACKYCPLKKACKQDYELGITEISKSTALSVAAFSRPGYDPAKKRAAVFDMWSMDDPLALS